MKKSGVARSTFCHWVKEISKIPKITEVRPCKPKKRHCFALDRPCAAQSRSYNTRSQHIPQHAQCGGSRSHLRSCHRLSATLAAIFSRLDLGHQRAALAQPISREANRLRRRMPVSSRKIKAGESSQIILTRWATIKGQEIIYFKLPTSTSHLTEDPNAGSVHSPCRAACRLRSSIRLKPAP